MADNNASLSENIWEKALHIISLDSRINSVVFSSIISKITLYEERDGLVILACRDSYSLDYVKGEVISTAISDALRIISGQKCAVSFVIEGNTNAAVSSTIGQEKAHRKELEGETSPNTNLSPALTFENFIVGNCNRYAHAASFAVSEKPGRTQFNPLFLWANSGLGKTHLMEAIGNRIVAEHPEKKVIYVTCENFTNQYIACSNSGSGNTNKAYEEFRNLYRNVDVLLIDDIQFLIGKEGTQMEFFNTFESLINAGKQIVITSDKAPNNLTSLDERLTSRFQNGYTMDIQPPDFETRKAIFLYKLNHDSIHVTDEVVNYVCENATSNIRQLNGAYNILSSFYALSNGEVNIDAAKDVLYNFLSPKKAQQITPEVIISVVSQYYNISVDKMKSKNRSRDVLVPRNVAMYLCHDLTDLTLKKIGELFGGKDHSSVINSINKVEDDPNLKRDLEEIRKSLV